MLDKVLMKLTLMVLGLTVLALSLASCSGLSLQLAADEDGNLTGAGTLPIAEGGK